MSTRAPTRHSGVTPLDRNTIKRIVPERKQRSWTSARSTFIHRTKNGCFDPYSYFHVAETLATLTTDKGFTAAEMAEWLNNTRPQISWDSVTVGRILNDMFDALEEAAGAANPIGKQRNWDGTRYWVATGDARKQALVNLIDDLVIVGTEWKEAELRGQRIKRLTSPLAKCASLLAATLLVMMSVDVQTGVAAIM